MQYFKERYITQVNIELTFLQKMKGLGDEEKYLTFSMPARNTERQV